ncbi:hypothetical protein [Nocardia sp. GTS18]|uniref:hypothetical protein n=1 Tax=Nocardia sp. GTS18 TaxID=1778064 RepID=UPI0015EFB55B|nr:hypothetical protein [Nocardia sp. GTS18]
MAQPANIPYEDWMQDCPIAVSDPAQLDEFVRLLLTNKTDWQLSFWFLDPALESGAADPDEMSRVSRLVPQPHRQMVAR